MQGEVDRYQDTVRMLRDYYKGMDGHYPEELNANYTRIPLIELPVERAESPDKSESETASNPPPAEEGRDSAKSDRPKSIAPNLVAPSPLNPLNLPKKENPGVPRPRNETRARRKRKRLSKLQLMNLAKRKFHWCLVDLFHLIQIPRQQVLVKTKKIKSQARRMMEDQKVLLLQWIRMRNFCTMDSNREQMP